MIDSVYFRDMLDERRIQREWVDRVLDEPEWAEREADGTYHAARRIPENGHRWLRVIVNEARDPPLLITAFFDRRLRKQHESQG